MMKFALLKLMLGISSIIGGVYLYHRFGPRRHRQALGVSSGILLGHHSGAVTGLLAAGPAPFRLLLRADDDEVLAEYGFGVDFHSHDAADDLAVGFDGTEQVVRLRVAA